MGDPRDCRGEARTTAEEFATYAVAGATLGLQTLWSALLTYPLMAAVQSICARLGMVSGQGLAGILRDHYPRVVLYGCVLLLFGANTICVSRPAASLGTGLGLHISQRIAEQHHGRLWLDPSSEGGSVFVLALPLAGA